MEKKYIDGGKAFDFGRTSADYAKYRDIYPQAFYNEILSRGLCVKGQNVLDLGTGTGVLPRNMYRFGAKWVGTDISAEQIEKAKLLSEGLDIDYFAVPSEKISFAENSFDVVTACQCFWYFDHNILAPILSKILRPDGRLLILYMAWLPFEDRIAGESEKLVLKYSPNWTGAGEIMRPIGIPDAISERFELTYHREFKTGVPFTRESWNGRMKSCRGVGASLSADETARWEEEHTKLLSEIAPDSFEILHYISVAELKKR